MNQRTDIRDQAYLSGSEVKKLNFIKASTALEFRKYYRSGLRSHIFEVLEAREVQKETQGEIIEGIRMFPRARPLKMFRILRTRFKNKEAVFQEIKKYNTLLKFLGSDLIALSEEFMADYTGTGESQIVLCGLQEYVDGQILDPWRLFGDNYLMDLFGSMPRTDGLDHPTLVDKARKNIKNFVKKIREMITLTGYIPDLAGIGNLILTPEGDLKLVDINNIVEIKLNDTIPLDDKGYPSCDVSIEVLSILERDILQQEIHMDDPLYRLFLSPERRKKVKAIENEFYTYL
ncbi:MAG: hypothetical protein DRH26_05255 [Deltaproteobacteria bacterium]|nr:MAG: hypothetical protein DRH26_05255 [Deltaproteobacteria bacterium]